MIRLEVLAAGTELSRPGGEVRRPARVGATVDLVHFLIHTMIMIRLNIHEAKTHLSRYLARLMKGETIILCRRNVPIAEIRPLPVTPRRPRPIGLAKGKFKVTRKFLAPLPEDVLSAFEGKGK
jgi:antitoxin (DNA-binding transcriptional repressor) of toxin-antitoxin stability system